MKNTLHIYGQGFCHQEALIIGDTEALKKLRHAIDNAIKNKVAEVDTFTADGEGYEICVANTEKVEIARLPYHDCNWVAEWVKKTGVDPWAIYRESKESEER